MGGLSVLFKSKFDSSGLVKGIQQANTQTKAGMGKLGAVAIAGATAVAGAVSKIAKDSLDAFKEFESARFAISQLYGTMNMTIEQFAARQGKTVEEVKNQYNTLDEAQNRLLADSQNAWLTGNISATQYLNTAKDIAAYLKKALGGDSLKAVEATKEAISVITDNWNTFGGDYEKIEKNIASLLKGRYRQMAQLKIGYNGTKEGMEQMIADANEYAKSIGEAGNLSLQNAADIIHALDLIQQKQGIAGAAQKKAEKTIQGSLARTKAAWQNVLIAIATPGADVEKAVSNFTKTFSSLAKHLIPIIGEILKSVCQVIKDNAPLIAETLQEVLDKALPVIINALGIIAATIIASIPGLLKIIFSSLKDNLGMSVLGIGVFLAWKFPAVLKLIKLPLTLLSNLFAPLFETLAVEIGVQTAIISNKLEGGLIATISNKVTRAGYRIADAFFLTFSRIGTALTPLFTNPVGIVLVAISALIVGFILLYKNCEPFRNWVNETGKQIQTMLAPALQQLGEMIKPLTDTFSQIAKDLQPVFTQLGKVIGDTVKQLAPVIGQIVTALGPALVSILQVIGVIIMSVIVPIIKVAAAILTPIISIIATVISILGKILVPIIQVVSIAITNFVNMLMSILMPILQFIQWELDTITYVVQHFGEIWEQIKTTIANAVGQIWNSIVSTFNSVIGFISGIPGRIMGFFAGVGTWLYNTGRDLINGLWNGINDMWNTVTGWIRGLFGGIGGLFKGSVQIQAPAKLPAFNSGKYFGYIGGTSGSGTIAYTGGLRDTIANDMITSNAVKNISQKNFTMNFYDTQTSPNAIYQKFRQQNTYGLTRSF